MSNNTLRRAFFGKGRLRMGIDGKGITTLCTFHGCPLRCKYCLNKRGLAPETKCDLLTPEELYDMVKIDDLYFQASGGGVTFGGGEPLLHTDFIAAFREICPDTWRLTAETSLYLSEEAVRHAATVVDDFIVDIKDTDPEIYLAYTGKKNDRVLANLRLLLSLVGPERIKVRVPLIPDFNTDANRENSKRLLSEMGIVHFDFFNYVIR